MTLPKPTNFIASFAAASPTNKVCQPPEHLPSHRLVFCIGMQVLSPTRYQELLRYIFICRWWMLPWLVRPIGDVTVNRVHSTGMLFTCVMNSPAVLKRPHDFYCWLPNDAVRRIKLVGGLLHLVDFCTADFTLPPNPLISLVSINTRGIPWWLTAG